MKKESLCSWHYHMPRLMHGDDEDICSTEYKRTRTLLWILTYHFKINEFPTVRFAMFLKNVVKL